MTESVERAIGWARLHRVRQFQFFGIPPVRCGVNCVALPARWHATRKARNG